MKRKVRLKLQARITLWIFCILVLSVGVTAVLNINESLDAKQRSIENKLYAVGNMVASFSPVIEELDRGTPPSRDSLIQQLAERLTLFDSDIDLIVVCDMNAIRHTHPNQELLGQRMIGGDETRVVETGERYLSTAEGTLGVSLRAFVPIVTEDGRQVGYVNTGTILSGLQEERRKLVLLSLSFLLWGLVIGGMGAVFLSQNLKNQMLDMEPEELAQLYREHQGMMDALREGVVAIGADCRVSLVNPSAQRLLGREGENLTGRPIEEVMPSTKLPQVLLNGETEYDREQVIGNRVVITNRVPIRENGKVVGAIATFQDKTQVTRLAEELTGVKQLVDALRANSHENQNRLHVVLGLMELGETEEAKRYIISLNSQQVAENHRAVSSFRDPVAAGLVLGKISYGREQKVRLEVDPDSFLEAVGDDQLSHSLVTILGNLLDNAIESARLAPDGQGAVRLLVRQSGDSIGITVEDNGPGIRQEDLPHLFQRGFSTKGPGRGTGLALIAQEIQVLGGRVTVESRPGVSTVFRAVVPLGRRDREEGEEEEG